MKKKMMLGIVVMLTMAFSPANFAQQEKEPASSKMLFINWYLEGYNDGYNDAINGRDKYYSAIRRPIPEWVHDEYAAGYEAGWTDGGGTK